MESNQLFVKTFIRQAFDEFGDRMAVVHLVRSPVDVAMSLYRLQQIPGTDVTEIWWLDHRAPTNIIQIADLLDSDAELSHPFYRALWYWYEVEMRFAAWRARLPSMKVVHSTPIGSTTDRGCSGFWTSWGSTMRGPKSSPSSCAKSTRSRI